MLKVENSRSISEGESVSIETVSTIKRLIAGLRSNDAETRREARNEVVFIGKPAVDFLIPTLEDPDDEVRREAANALSELPTRELLRTS
jgi:HEAT repeat protein